MKAYDFVLPLRTVSTLNRREHWAVRHKRNKAERTAAHLMCPRFTLPCIVTVTRVAPRQLDGHDNLQASAKAIVDGIASKLGLITDRDERVQWRYAQEKGPYAVRVLLEAA